MYDFYILAINERLLGNIMGEVFKNGFNQNGFKGSPFIFLNLI